MSTDTIRELLESYIQMNYPAYQPSVPIKFANTRFDNPTVPWIYVTVIPNMTTRANIGANGEFEVLGCVNVTCMVPEHTGTKNVRALADSVANVLLDRQIMVPGGGHITTYGLDTRERGVVNGWYAVNVFVNWRARILLPNR